MKTEREHIAKMIMIVLAFISTMKKSINR